MFKRFLVGLSIFCLLATVAVAQALIGYRDTTNKVVQGVGDDKPLPVVFQALSSIIKDDDASVQNGASELHWAVVSFVGVTIGDKIEILNSRYVGEGTSICTLQATAANQTMYFDPHGEVEADSGLYYDVTLSGGTATATIVYK